MGGSLRAVGAMAYPQGVARKVRGSASARQRIGADVVTSNNLSGVKRALNTSIQGSNGSDANHFAQCGDRGGAFSLWAKNTTGVDPVAIAQAATQPAAPSSGGAPVAGGAAKGAAAGALIGAVAGDAGKGAAIGATTGGLAGGHRARKQKEQQQAQLEDAAARSSSPPWPPTNGPIPPASRVGVHSQVKPTPRGETNAISETDATRHKCG